MKKIKNQKIKYAPHSHSSATEPYRLPSTNLLANSDSIKGILAIFLKMNGDDEMKPDKVGDISTAIPLQSPAGENARAPLTESRVRLLPADAMHIVDGFCGMCRQILDNWGELDEEDTDSRMEFAHHSVLGMRKSAERGCTLCTLFLGDAANFGHFRLGIMEADAEDTEVDVEDMDTGEDVDTIEATPIDEESIYLQSTDSIQNGDADQEILDAPRILVLRSSESTVQKCWRCLTYGEDGKLFSSILFWPVLDPDEGQQKPGRPSSTVPSRDDLMLLAKEWMGDCNKQHNKCTQSIHDEKLPTRLLYIGRRNLRLRLSLSLPSDTRYATLSHCWGLGENLKLVKSNLKAFQRTIPRNQLCKTFQDAIFIASQLDLDYLWIDSLCIIQDDEEDWRQESALMGMVYGNSYLNIAAAGASDGSQGCFFQDNPMRINKVRVRITAADKNTFYDCVPASIYRHCIGTTPLSSRAWALQERLLAPRTLHFSRGQLFWECNEGYRCESLSYPIPLKQNDSDWYLEKRALSEFWNKILYIYSTCRLTKVQDKLVAISGIIRKIQVEKNDKCVAGLWKSEMEIQLLWYVPWLSPRPDIYVSPSWSWASVNGSVYGYDFYEGFFGRGRELHTHVLDVHVKSCGNDPLGELSDGNILLSCQTLVCVTLLGPAPCEDGPWHFHKEKMKIDGKDMKFESWICWDCQEESLRSVYLLPISGSICGLILVPTDQEQGQYRRVGLFASLLDSSWGIQELGDIVMNPEHSAGADAFAGFNDSGKYEVEQWVLNIV
ncbi:uncharacterized protein PAC_17220 [Phialocephala subalpina]|uniref:Heterokaryon incompatibility domain-containing protein n=1 Tax=Phialocephala subalpina TaxID=576137 RepID=A0A1L7XQJ1_9HELO|nr:uncharacterized protein PAC_17220 [Phialocephala subalpina]